MEKQMIEVEIKVNGREYRDIIPSDMMLIDYLRKHRLLTGTEKAWRGECGACTVLLNGKAIHSCITLAIQASGKSVRPSKD